ncbi:signal peptidase II [Ketobacter alkanivorans]|uniref:Lipoprotein signal peptidase n=1 Tax=Ketobacter alkanivorans TaxID=1917421 RepID=A0A2K9LHY2_9GAMM|nr:signal peptidase II [Ketobacter alkanivorans]AUM11968.1 signal peptidase II [Ketobacter alkanivorans]MCP5019063.1 lipoprotein signal peptidase [Ketobacter sp.]
MTETVKDKTGQATGMLQWLWLSAVVVVLDQITKLAVDGSFEKYERLEILPFFNLTLAYNKGAAFSFLAGAGGWQRWFFTAIAVGVSVMLIVWLRKLPKTDWWSAISISMILGGALGNLYDRVVYGHVIDFLDFHWQGSHFPAFNVADSAITVGAAMMILEMFRNPGNAK